MKTAAFRSPLNLLHISKTLQRLWTYGWVVLAEVWGCFLREWEGLQTDGAELLRVTVAEPDLVCPEAKRLPEGSST